MVLKNLHRISVIFSIFTVGFTAIAAQIIFLREFLVVFYGNEISVGIVLFSWLIWGAVGSYCFGGLLDRSARKEGIFAWCQLCAAIVLPVVFFCVCVSRGLLGVLPGEIIGYIPLAVISFLVLAIPCILFGLMFSLSCGLYNSVSGAGGADIGRVYVYESWGAVIGGLIVGSWMMRFYEPSFLVISLSVLNVVASLFFLYSSCREKHVFSVVKCFAVFLLFLSVFFAANGYVAKFRDISLSFLWKGYDLTGNKDSIYGNVAAVRNGSMVSFYENGLCLYSVPDLLSSEETVHYAMLSVPRVKNVLLIGGGISGRIKEILKYDVDHIDYVELDPALIEMAKEKLKDDDLKPIVSPKVSIINVDGRAYVKTSDAKYDCVIMGVGDPLTLQLNRFYTVEFFGEVKRVLKSDGVFAFSVTSSENYIGPEMARYLASIKKSLSLIFKDVAVIPGDTAYFLAAGKDGIITRDIDIITNRLKQNAVETKYVRDYYLSSKLSSDRIAYVDNALLSAENECRVNMDFRPSTYLYAISLWTSQFEPGLVRNLMGRITDQYIWLAVGVLCLFFVAIFIFLGMRVRNAVIMSIGTVGFANIVFEMVLILAFQAMYGYLFYKMGVLIAIFMAGLASGAFFASRASVFFRRSGVYFAAQSGVCVLAALLPVLFESLRMVRPLWIGADFLCLLLPFFAGTLGGVQFASANAIWVNDNEGIVRAGGVSYGIDLFGACLGALLTATVLVPVLGFYGTCAIVSVINMCVLLLYIAAVFAKK